MRTTHVIVHGRVQGVFFRDTVRREALARRLTGWVRNLPDGTVEMILCGPQEKIDDMLTWLPQGSPNSRVDKIDSRELEDAECPATFKIRY